MKSYNYRGIKYHIRTSFYYLSQNRIQNIETMGNKKKFKTHEEICNYIDDYMV